MRLIKLFILLLFPVLIFAQHLDASKLKLDHYLNIHPVKKFNNFSVLPDTLHVYAVRVQFKDDNNTNTTGNGRLDLSNNYPDSVDAPPHDDAYFNNHLEFLKNYYVKSSKGKLVIAYHLIGDIRNLPKEMADYSPRKGENLSRIGNLFFDTWRSVDSVYDFSGIDPSSSAFVIFHAGVGKDVNLKSQGIFQGELDIPSLYFGPGSIRSIYGDTAKGFYTNDGFIINNSAILPEQEWRLINTSFGDAFLELGLNGIVVATIGSHLGLPDLFNTETGVTAIGRFGLMDGQSLFSYLGVFPPEPSAWEKQYLGWVQPVILLSNGTYTSRAASIDNGTSSVYKVYKSAKEYFLIENRNRDANNNGQTIHYVVNGNAEQITFTKDEDGFDAASIWKLKGSVTDVDELDWSLPGLKNDTSNFQGGILIWDIDENVIDAKIASNTINNDINHKGVDLEEAKGAQQIGVTFNTPFGQVIGEGTIVDYWFNGDHLVPSDIYRNEFTPTSIPNSKTYSNINSRICLRNFSVITPEMSFTYEICSPIANIQGFPRFIGFEQAQNYAQPVGIDINGNGLDEVFININGALYGYRDNGSSFNPSMPNGFLYDSVAQYMVGYIPQRNGDIGRRLVSSYNNKVYFISPDSSTNITGYEVSKTIASPVIYPDPLGNGQTDTLYYGTNDGFIIRFETPQVAVPVPFIAYDSVSNAPVTELAFYRAFTRPDVKFVVTGKLITENNNEDTLEVTNDNKLLINGVNVSANSTYNNIYSSPVLADLNKDGNMDIIFPADDKLYAVNRHGVVLDNFPFTLPGVSRISGGVSVADLNGDGFNDVIFGTGDGRVYAYGANGQILPDFPLLTGKEVRSTPAIINDQGNFGIIVYSTDGYIYGWKTAWAYNQSAIVWKNYLRDQYHRNFNFDRSSQIASGDCLPKEKVYNWPNPVYGGSTNIRYFLNGTASTVKIKIMDLSGELVTTLTGSSNSGYENEVTWDVSSVQSGIYIGVVELEGGSCTSAVSFKIAVIK